MLVVSGVVGGRRVVPFLLCCLVWVDLLSLMFAGFNLMKQGWACELFA